MLLKQHSSVARMLPKCCYVIFHYWESFSKSNRMFFKTLKNIDFFCHGGVVSGYVSGGIVIENCVITLPKSYYYGAGFVKRHKITWYQGM